MLVRLGLAGNPNLGVFVRATESTAFIPNDATRSEERQIAEALEVPTVRLSIGGTRLLGSLMAGNSRGLIVSDILLEREQALLERQGLNLVTLAHPLNAIGNTVLVNDRGALVGPEYPAAVVDDIGRTLGVPVVQGTLAGLATVGMAGVATSTGVLVHPKATPEEREVVRRALGADVLPGTINHGTGLIGAGLAANSRGAIVGAASTGIELGRVEDAFGYLDRAGKR